MSRNGKLGCLVAFLILLPFLAYAASQFVPQYDMFVVTSGSMEPEIDTGALLFTHKASPERIQVGDTITFEEGDHFTTHKVINVSRSGEQLEFKTQGIANNAPDPGTVTGDELAGKKLFSIPFLGYVITWAGTTTGKIVLIIVPAIILILMEFGRIFSERRSS